MYKLHSNDLHHDHTDANGVHHVYVHHYSPNHKGSVVIRDEDDQHIKKIYIDHYHSGWIIALSIILFILAVLVIIGCVQRFRKE